MALPALVRSADLTGFPGSPYPDPLIRAAEASVRRDAGWHIAPVIRQTLTVTWSGSVVHLPTQRIVTVHSVVLAVDATFLNGWEFSADGVLYLPRWWGRYGDRIRVDLTHGYDTADDLLPVIAGRCQRSLTDATITQRSETQGSRSTSESYNSARLDPTSGLDAIAAYRLPVVA